MNQSILAMIKSLGSSTKVQLERTTEKEHDTLVLRLYEGEKRENCFFEIRETFGPEAARNISQLLREFVGFGEVNSSSDVITSEIKKVSPLSEGIGEIFNEPIPAVATVSQEAALPKTVKKPQAIEKPLQLDDEQLSLLPKDVEEDVVLPGAEESNTNYAKLASGIEHTETDLSLEEAQKMKFSVCGKVNEMYGLSLGEVAEKDFETILAISILKPTDEFRKEVDACKVIVQHHSNTAQSAA